MRAGVGPRAATPALSGALGTFTTETPPRGTYLLQNLPRGAATVLSAQRAPRPLGAPGPASLPLPWAISTRPASLGPGWAGNGHLPGGREPSPGGSSYWTCPHPALHRPGVGTVHPLRTRVCLPKPGHGERHLHSGRVVRGLGSCRGASQVPGTGNTVCLLPIPVPSGPSGDSQVPSHRCRDLPHSFPR